MFFCLFQTNVKYFEGDIREVPIQQCLYYEIVQFDFIETVCETGMYLKRPEQFCKPYCL